jgi:hypothetical protein
MSYRLDEPSRRTLCVHNLAIIREVTDHAASISEDERPLAITDIRRLDDYEGDQMFAVDAIYWLNTMGQKRFYLVRVYPNATSIGVKECLSEGDRDRQVGFLVGSTPA